MPINRLISIIEEQSMLRFFVIIDFMDYQFLLSMPIDQLIDINCHRLVTIFDALYFHSIFSNTASLRILMRKTAIKLYFFHNGD